MKAPPGEKISKDKKLHLSVLIFFVCLLFSFLLWDHYFNSADPIDRMFVSNLVLAMGILFSASAGLLVWSMESGKDYLEKEIIRRTEALVAKEKETALAEAKRSEAEHRHRELETAFRQLKDTQDQLIQSEKIASVGRIVAGIVHELNTPLVTMAGYMKLLMRTGFDKDTEVHLAVIDRQAERCRKIVGSLLTYARWDKPKFKPVGLCELIETTLAGMPVDFHRKEIHILKEYPGQSPVIEADSDQLQHVLSNLLVNAWQAFEETHGLKQIKITVIPGEDSVQVFFTDTGPGIAKENLDKIFEPFFTTKAAGKGTGLGLSLVYAIVQMHGGKITVESEMGKGSVFVVELPFKQASIKSLEEKPAGEIKKRVLAVDDEPAVLQFLGHLLHTWGYEYVTAANGEDAIRIAEDEKERIALIVLDINMPGLDGFETARSLSVNNRSSKIPVIFLTARTDLFDAGKTNLLNIHSILKKPFDYQELKQSIAHAVHAI